MTIARFTLGLAACVLFASVQSASAQGFNSSSRRYRIDQQDSIGRYSPRQQWSIGRGRQHSPFTPVSPIGNTGTYIEKDGGYFYQPQSTVIGSGAVPTPESIQYGGFSHVDDLAHRLEQQMEELLLDMYYNYGHNHGFRATYAEAYQLYEVARFVHAQEHQHNHADIRQHLNGMDALFHHIEEDVCGWSRHHHIPVGTLGIEAKLHRIESTLHHLMNDVGVGQVPPPATSLRPPRPGFFLQIR